MLGVVIERYHGMLTRNVYCSHVLDGVLDYAVLHGYQISIIVLLKDNLAHALSNIENGMVDGVVLVAPASTSPLLDWAHTSRFPTVAVGCVPSAQFAVPCVDVDNRSSMFEGVSRLIAEGHRRIGFIGGPWFQQSSQIREEAYRSALLRAGIEPRPEWITQGDFQHKSGFTGALRLLEVEPRITAIVAANDMAALGALEALRLKRIEVPDEMSVLGFDDIFAASISQPPLTTVRQPMQEIGSRAAEMLIREIETGARDISANIFPGTLVMRSSVASVKEVKSESRFREPVAV